LVDRTFDDVTVIDVPYPPGPLRYSVRRAAANGCPSDSSRRPERLWDNAPAKTLRDRGECPTVEDSDRPSEGIFVVSEGAMAAPGERAISFQPRYMTARPPTAVIEFWGIEVQRRSSGDTEVLAETRYYEAPGYLGLPPLIDCWERPDNIVWILPPGNTGCGFWRRAVGGGDRRYVSDASWVYSTVFTRSP
jgi:hypothetical protein